MSTVPARAGWTLAATALLGMTATATARTDPAPLRLPPASALAQPIAVPSAAGTARLAEIKVELAWLADPTTFPYPLAACVEAGRLVVGGTVPAPAIKQQALELARLHGGLPLVDRVLIRAVPAQSPVRCKSEALCTKAIALLREKFSDDITAFEISASDEGLIVIEGKIGSYEEKLSVSRRLSRVDGCVGVDNQLTVETVAVDGKPLAKVTADGRWKVTPEKPAAHLPQMSRQVGPPLPAVPQMKMPGPVVNRGPAPVLPVTRAYMANSPYSGVNRMALRTATKPATPAVAANALPVTPAPVAEPVKPAVAAAAPPAVKQASFHPTGTSGIQRTSAYVAPSSTPATATAPPTAPATTPRQFPASGQEQPLTQKAAAPAKPGSHPTVATGPRPAPIPSRESAITPVKLETSPAPLPATTTQPAGPPIYPPQVLATLRQRVERTCAGQASQVLVTAKPDRSLVITVKVAKSVSKERLGMKVLQMPELKPYAVALEIEELP